MTISSCSRRIAALLVIACSAACSASGPDFAAYDPIPDGEGRLYVYRPSARAGLGGISVDLNGETLVSLWNEGYVSVVLPPGEYTLSIGWELWSEDFGRSRFRAGPGRTVYCSLTHVTDLTGTRWQTACSTDADAHAELRQCRRQEVEKDSPWRP